MEDLASGFGAPSGSGRPARCCSQIRAAWGGEGGGCLRYVKLVITSHYQLDLSEVGDGNVAAVPSVSRWQGDGGGSLNACAPTQYCTRLHDSLPALADAWRIRMIRGDMCECICNPLGRHC